MPSIYMLFFHPQQMPTLVVYLRVDPTLAQASLPDITETLANEIRRVISRVLDPQ